MNRKLEYEYKILERIGAVGRTCILLECPCCGREVRAFVWSLAGSGKRCLCGALHTRTGTFPAADFLAEDQS